MDFLSKAKRSALMATIRSRRNKSTELELVKIFRLNGITGWRRHIPLVGRPDFAFRQQRVAVFVDGCFWHGCPKHATFPATRRAFWLAKFARNKARDRLVTRTLRKNGWRVLRIWEHELRKPVRVLARIRNVLAAV